jgi:hypothetical protein
MGWVKLVFQTPISDMRPSHAQRCRPLLVAGFSTASVLLAGDPVPDKSGYHLFNPVPREQMRELSTDRPDQTESPYSVDAGHIQIEADLVSFSRDHDRSAPGGGVVNETTTFGAVNLKAGLLNNVDLQLVLDAYVRSRTTDRATGVTDRVGGLGDLTTRLKVNLWGNDGGKTALALMPYVKAPTARRGLGNNSVEGGLIVPLAVELPGGFGMGLQTEADAIRNDGRSGHHLEWVNSVTVGHDLVGALAGYVEFFTVTSFERGAPWEGYFDLGLTYGLTDTIQLDLGCNFGVTDAAPDYNPFVGISLRF